MEVPAIARGSETASSPPPIHLRRAEGLVGVGIGLRWEFLDTLLQRLDETAGRPKLPFFEVSPENYMRRGGYIPESLERVAQHYPLISHGLAMNFGGTARYDDAYFRSLGAFLARFPSPWHSDHLCFGGSGGRALHDLLPLPHTRVAVAHTAARVREAQDRLGLPLAIENISYYAHLGQPEMREQQFVAEVLEAADCKLLLDVNNVYVNSLNHGFDAKAWLSAVDMSRVTQLHVAGHDHHPEDDLYIDTHGAPVCDPVIELLTWVVARTGPVAVVLERDNAVPALDVLLAERERLQQAYDRGIQRYRASRRDVSPAPRLTP